MKKGEETEILHLLFRVFGLLTDDSHNTVLLAGNDSKKTKGLPTNRILFFCDYWIFRLLLYDAGKESRSKTKHNLKDTVMEGTILICL